MDSNLFIGRKIIRLKQVDSTNNYARQIVRDSTLIEGTVVLTDEQTEGRGQRGNSWVSAPHLNLTCSYILRPNFLATKNQFMLSAAVALAVSETVSELVCKNQVSIKWPNDILVDGKKIAGILIENTLRRSNLEASIVGIGLNINQIEFPPEINATSLKCLLGDELDISPILSLLSQKLEKRYLRIREGKFDEILSNLNAELFEINNLRNLSINGITKNVKILGVKHLGELELQHVDGTKTLHQHHEIDWLLLPR